MLLERSSQACQTSLVVVNVCSIIFYCLLLSTFEKHLGTSFTRFKREAEGYESAYVYFLPVGGFLVQDNATFTLCGPATLWKVACSRN